MREQDSVPPLTIRDAWDQGTAVVTLSGEIDVSCAGSLAECLNRILAGQPRQLIIDMAGVGFIDSSGVHAIVRARRQMPPGCPVVLRSPRKQARRVFELTRLDTLVTIE